MTDVPVTWGHGWRTSVTGAAGLVRHDAGLRFVNAPEAGRVYANAQIDTYRGLPRSRFGLAPPLRLHVRARFSHPAQRMHGTAGFGFWNDPFMMSGTSRPALPAALWFFLAGRPSDMALAAGVPGHGWKAATIDVRRPLFYALAPGAPLAMLLMRSRTLYRRLWPLAQRAMGVHEALLSVDITGWHDYELVWTATDVRFHVNGVLVLRAPQAPRGPLGCVIWLDNQFMVVRPTGVIRHGLVARGEREWMEVREVVLEKG
ncbi:MAG: hypothetical protein H6644_17020 [Caldilineaceae bacterium]|nr:hypothetical protein [Caldilineaceae bacterium]